MKSPTKSNRNLIENIINRLDHTEESISGIENKVMNYYIHITTKKK
jgi:hypothetical protein